MRLVVVEDQPTLLPVIIIKGDGVRRTRLDAIRAGAAEFLEKPVRIDGLRLRLRNLLSLHEARKQAREGQAPLEPVIAASGASVVVADLRAADTPITHASAPQLPLPPAEASGQHDRVHVRAVHQRAPGAGGRVPEAAAPDARASRLGPWWAVRCWGFLILYLYGSFCRAA